mmetsp:Transcript_1742/g.4129  ORF Transcript_1742/g.4129 Transcript_1742/m.4129 type:complete len:211 (+) Transcript_1742:375-1007(+)
MPCPLSSSSYEAYSLNRLSSEPSGSCPKILSRCRRPCSVQPHPFTIKLEFAGSHVYSMRMLRTGTDSRSSRAHCETSAHRGPSSGITSGHLKVTTPLPVAASDSTALHLMCQATPLKAHTPRRYTATENSAAATSLPFRTRSHTRHQGSLRPCPICDTWSRAGALPQMVRFPCALTPRAVPYRRMKLPLTPPLSALMTLLPARARLASPA